MRIGFSTLWVPGHLNPMTAVARKLQSRGHDVFFIGILDSEPFVRAAGLDFFPIGQDVYPAGAVRRGMDELSRLNGFAAIRYTIDEITRVCRVVLSDGGAAARAARAEAFVIDMASTGMELVAACEDLPFVHVSNALHLDFGGETPLPLFDWPYSTSLPSRLRNRVGLRILTYVLKPLTAARREYAERQGLRVDWKDLESQFSKLAIVTQCPQEFDFPRSNLPPQFHYAGPFHDSLGRAPADFPWNRLTGEPLIYASMGTLQNGSTNVFRTIVEGASGPNRQLVLALGGNLEPAALGALPPGTIAVRYAPQIDLLKRAALTITHAGLNTALESLAQGTPMVAIPVTNDQPGVAARIRHTGTGDFIPLRKLTAPRLRAAVDKVLADATYRKNARWMQRAISAASGLERAADIIERAFGGSSGRA